MAQGGEAGAIAATLPGALPWIVGACVVLLVAVHRDTLRAALLRAVDPRPLALFRVGFALTLLLGALEIASINEYLYSDEGLLPSAAVPQLFGRRALWGYGDGLSEPARFLDVRGALDSLTSGRWSLLYFWDSPAFVRGYFAVFVAACVGLALGVRTRACAALVWLLYAGMLRRDDAHWGGEQVYCSLLFLLVISRCGVAYSVDNLLRCRRLRRRGLLDRPEGPGRGGGAPPSAAHPHGLAAIYRRAPVWPQVLIAAQVALCYCANGWLKSGESWRTGDAMYLALHLDRYTRLDWHALAVALPSWTLQLASWSVLWWERLFPLVLVGLWMTWREGQVIAAPTRRARALGLACWGGLAGALALAATRPSALGDVAEVEQGIRAVTCGAAALVIAGASVGAFARGTAARRLARAACSPRLWLGFGLLFHALNVALFNVGAFPLALVAAYPLCGAGAWTVAALGRVARALARRGLPVPEGLAAAAPAPCEHPSLPHLRRADARLPGWALVGAGALILVGLAAARSDGEHARWWWHGVWLTLGAGLLLLSWIRGRGERAEVAGAPLAYGPAGRLAAGGVFTYHALAVLLSQAPPWASFPRRDTVRALVEPWLELTFTRQRWGMYSPNPPRQNQALQTVIIDADGVEHDLATELERPEHLTRPYLWHDRARKLEEVMMEYRRWIARWHARYLCRRWALDHHGAPPQRVLLRVRTAPYPPRAPVDPVAFFWERAEVTATLEVPCETEPFATLDAEVRARHGFEARPLATVTRDRDARPERWAERRQQLDPLQPLWPGLALLLVGALALWARGERRRV